VIRVATRGSALALAQAHAVAARLEAGGARVEVVAMRTEGDRRAEARLAAIGGKGLFVREIEDALLRGDADVAVHSLKDLPAEVPPGLTLAVFPEREDPRDLLVSRAGGDLEALPRGARVGSSSPRRRAIVLSLRPDLAVEPIRGNVDTRLAKLDAGDWDAVILAAAGLRRLEITPRHATLLAPDVFVPAVGQGVLGVEARADDAATLAALRPLDHAATRACAVAERAFLARLGASCVTPMAAHARLADGRLVLHGLVASEDGREMLRERAEGTAADAAALGRAVAEALLARGASAITALRPVEVSGGR
jgi:hydroxymethylbilane synthase